jgi:hypothetical protein
MRRQALFYRKPERKKIETHVMNEIYRKEKIAIFIAHHKIIYSPSILNLIGLLRKHYDIDLYVKNVGETNLDILNSTNIRIIDLSNIIIEIIEKARFESSQGPRQNNDHSLLKDIIRLLYFSNIRTLQRYINTFLKVNLFYRHNNYKTYICIDPHGFVLCKKYFSKSKPFYYSLELYMKKDHKIMNYRSKLMNTERKDINTIKGLIIQSAEKDELFRQDYYLKESIPTFMLPVTYDGPSINSTSNYIRNKYNIDAERKIALHLGGIAYWFSCAEIANIFGGLSGWILFFHGHFNRNYFDQMTSTLKRKKITNVIFSDEYFSSIYEIDKIIAACDLGIAWYNNVAIGFRAIGKSSGKIAAYMKGGLPVICNKYKSTVKAIEIPKCGICVDDVREIPHAVKTIENNYNYYSTNTKKEYDRTYNFQNYKESLMQFLEQ